MKGCLDPGSNHRRWLRRWWRAVRRGGQRPARSPQAQSAAHPAQAARSSTASKVDPSRRTEDVNRRNADGSTPLQWAVYEGDVAEVKRLLRAGADVSLANNYGATPMSLAAEVGNTEMLKVLLEAGANADSPNPDGQTALLAVARTGNVEAAQLLLNHGATVDAREKWGGQTALMWASARRHPEMMQLLISKGADVNARSIDRNYQRHVTAEGRPKSLDSGGLTPLLYAARENCMACVDVLLENGADIDLPDPDGVSPLLVAIMNANWDLARQLIAGRRRRQSVGHLRRGAAVHGGRPAQSDRRRTGVDRSAEQDQRPDDRQRCCSSAAPIRTCSCSSGRRTCGARPIRAAPRR